jgi:hypothetical protein
VPFCQPYHGATGFLERGGIYSEYGWLSDCVSPVSRVGVRSIAHYLEQFLRLEDNLPLINSSDGKHDLS